MRATSLSVQPTTPDLPSPPEPVKVSDEQITDSAIPQGRILIVTDTPVRAPEVKGLARKTLIDRVRFAYFPCARVGDEAVVEFGELAWESWKAVYPEDSDSSSRQTFLAQLFSAIDKVKPYFPGSCTTRETSSTWRLTLTEALRKWQGDVSRMVLEYSPPSERNRLTDIMAEKRKREERAREIEFFTEYFHDDEEAQDILAILRSL